MCRRLIDKSQEHVAHGAAEALQGQHHVVGRKSPKSLYSMKTVTFEGRRRRLRPARREASFKLNALRLRLRATGKWPKK